ncbi:hypothetical protein [Rhizobium sp. MHM7A]|uniref:hypothetical protein n=1 Tax=Rhizobium sp. MHM7A TaxID=2583233 RepID=UPI001106CB21|nr:hypothetical protein [Rhizobium sp. MHM7A]TLX16875.1 hypothetical protein FFR93_05885 [Rhizobium sp. MHM7A]
MFQLVTVVIAITLSAFVVIGGISYFNSDTGVRLQVQQSLNSQLEGIAAAIGSYRSENNGFLPSSNIDAIAGNLPGGKIPTLSQDDELKWKLQGGNLCLERLNSSDMNTAVKAGTTMFVSAASRARPAGTVKVGSSCTDSQAFVWDASSNAADLEKNNTIAVIFELK